MNDPTGTSGPTWDVVERIKAERDEARAAVEELRRQADGLQAIDQQFVTKAHADRLAAEAERDEARAEAERLRAQVAELRAVNKSLIVYEQLRRNV